MFQKYGILAYPARHSLSPVVHNAAFKAMDIGAEYETFEVAEEDIGDFIKQVKSLPISGFSVSLPYKELILDYLDEIDEDVRKIGACNTVVNRNGILYGFNTDYQGAVLALKEVVEGLNGRSAVILGAGGSSRAIAYGLMKEGAKVMIFNRTEQKARQIAEDFGKIFKGEIWGGGLIDIWKIEESDILIQATSVWMLDSSFSEDPIRGLLTAEFVDKFKVVMDIVYKPLMTPLIKMAMDLEKMVVMGDKMLLYQAAEQFRLWTGMEAPLEVMAGALGGNLEK